MSEWTEALRARLADLRDAWRAIRRTPLQTATMISWRDPAAPVAVTAVLLVVSILATLWPTSRAWRIDPVEALRMD